MSAGAPRVRDLLPVDRISTARIRQAIKACPDIDQWSCATAGAIRPTLLARLVRDALWEALSLETSKVSTALDEEGGSVRFGLTLEVDTGSDRPVTLPIVVTFVRCGSGRIALTIVLECGGEPFELVSSRCVLAPPVRNAA